MNTTFSLKFANGEKTYEIINQEFYLDMVKTVTTPEAGIVWLALGEVAGHLQLISETETETE